MMTQTLENDLLSFFKEREGIVAVYLFGSEARERATASSDIDVAVLFEPDSVPDAPSQLEMQEALAVHLQRDVDLVVLNKTGPILRQQIFRHGRRLSCQKPDQLAAFFVKSIMEYADLKKIRAPIERAIAQRASHGG